MSDAALVRELDVLLNGEAGAAKQASLCDIVAQVAKENPRAAIAELVAALEIAEEFVDRHSEPWYLSGQQDLATIRATISKHKKESRNG